jgi:hypothetical protein
VEFCAVDVARDENRVRSVYEGLVSKRTCPSAQTVALDVVNQTLARFPIPQQIPGVYLAAELAVGQALRNCGVEASAFTTRRNENGTFVLQAKSITAQETLWS